MYEKINEIIDVVASFKKTTVEPKFFFWRRKIYKVGKVHLIHTSRQGAQILYHFSVTDEINYFELIFNPLLLSWTLENLYTAG